MHRIPADFTPEPVQVRLRKGRHVALITRLPSRTSAEPDRLPSDRPSPVRAPVVAVCPGQRPDHSRRERLDAATRTGNRDQDVRRADGARKVQPHPDGRRLPGDAQELRGETRGVRRKSSLLYDIVI